MKKPRFKPFKKILSEMLRVDHAGEYGAVKIYEAQKKNLANSKHIDEIDYMLKQEEKHLEYFSEKLPKTMTRPSIFIGFWHYLSYYMGYFSSRSCNYKGAMLCTKAVEDVIEKHYQEQIDYCEKNQAKYDHKDLDFLENIKKFYQEEIEHKDKAIESAEFNFFPDKIFEKIIKIICKMAIKISKKI